LVFGVYFLPRAAQSPSRFRPAGRVSGRKNAISPGVRDLPASWGAVGMAGA
jgi:hypothetical protein